jgi:hypothetical protein
MSIDTPMSEDFSPLNVKHLQRDSVFRGASMAAMLRRTASLGTMQSGNSHTMFFPYEEYSPRCFYVNGTRTFELTDNATYDGAPGAVNTCTFSIPWFVSPGYDGVSARIIAKTNINRPVSVRLKVGTMISAATAKTGPPSVPALPQSNNFPTMYDDTGARRWNLSRSVYFDCHVNVDVETNPECAISVELMPQVYGGRLSPHELRRSRNIYMAIQSITIYDRKYDRG